MISEWNRLSTIISRRSGKRDAGCMCGRSLLSLSLSAPEEKNAELKQIEVEAEIAPFEPLLKKQKSAKAFLNKMKRLRLLKPFEMFYIK
ncbi:hypothetical protein OE903_04060 [Bacillus sp. B6(2022)]|nr:hypothetical protein [Bacillus sp. B6(2022)]